jgi:uncharacterized membrane protein
MGHHLTIYIESCSGSGYRFGGQMKIAGHPVHPMLIVFPLGLLATSVIFDIITLSTSDGKWSTMA